ncbi:MAG: YciI family protein [Acidobacteriota bacterium]
MANFLYIFRGGDATQRSPEEMQAHMQRWRSWIAELAKVNRFKGGDPLEASGKIVTGKKKVVTDGPYAEAKDVVGGYLLVEAENLGAATEMSMSCPIFDGGGSVEVRPIARME